MFSVPAAAAAASQRQSSTDLRSWASVTRSAPKAKQDGGISSVSAAAQAQTAGPDV